MQRLFVVGGGEHARVVMEAVRSRPERFALIGFVDPQACEETARRLDVPRLGDDGDAAALCAEGALAVLGVGAVGVSGARRALVERL
jgi:FlaA1/EpsC-like NDP-sugar epimerase